MGSRSTRPGNEKVYEAADEWVENALRTAGSLFNSGSILTPNKPIWSRRWLGELRERFLNHPDKSTCVPFLTKLERRAGKRLEIAALDLSGTIDELLAGIGRLARRVRALRLDSD